MGACRYLDLRRKFLHRDSHGVRHLGMGASSPKMRIEKRKSAASVSSYLDGGGKRKNSHKIWFFAHLIVSLQQNKINKL